MLQFTICIQKISSISNRLEKLKAVYNEYFKQPGTSQFYANLVASYINLLSEYKFQLWKYSRIAALVNKFQKCTYYCYKFTLLLDWQSQEASINKSSTELFDSSVLETIYYACSKHKWNSTDNAAARYCPYKLAESHKVMQSQFEWIALHERSRSQSWRDVELLFEKKVTAHS